MPEPINELDCTRFRRKDTLIQDAEVAMAWGMPDNESIGYSRGELIGIIRKLVRRVKELEKNEKNENR